MTNELKEFFQQTCIQQALENNDFDLVYTNAAEYEVKEDSLRNRITNFLLDLDIDIFSYITKLQLYQFAYNSKIETVNIQEPITRVELGAFMHCSALKNVKLPDTVTELGRWAFSSCSWLEEFPIVKNLQKIELDAFKNCSFKSVILPDSVTDLGSYSFNGCSDLTSITIPKNIVNIGSGVFKRCNNLKDIIFEGTQKDWKNVFKDSRWKLESDVTKIKCVDGDIIL